MNGLTRAAKGRSSLLVRDGVGAALLMLSSLLPLGVAGLRLGELHRDLPLWVRVVLVAAQTLPLAGRRVLPASTLAMVGTGFAVTHALGAETGLAGLGLLMALYSCAAYLPRGRVAVVGGCAAAYLILVAVLIAENSSERPIDWVTFPVVLAVPWVAGELTRRGRTAAAAALDRAAAEADRAARSLLARDLHDIVTRHVTAMVVQAESAPYLPGTPEGAADRDAILASVGSTGRLALTELRSLLGTIDPDATAGATELTAADTISRMVDRIRETGYPISLQTIGPVEEIPSEIARVMRTVAREAVTNAMKHARGEAVELVVRTTASHAELIIANAVSARTPPPAAGRGTAGMRDSVADSGGAFTAEARAGQYTATARWAR